MQTRKHHPNNKKHLFIYLTRLLLLNFCKKKHSPLATRFFLNYSDRHGVFNSHFRCIK